MDDSNQSTRQALVLNGAKRVWSKRWISCRLVQALSRGGKKASQRRERVKLNQATDDWYTDHVAPSAAKGLNREILRCALT